MSKSAKQTEVEDVVLQKHHIHCGHAYEPGEKISVNAVQKAWLIKHNVIAGDTAQPK